MAPDLDILIRSSEDPLLLWVMHRQFSHALAFIPLGGLIVALVLWIFLRRHFGFGWIYLASTLGFATHGLLDAFTSYGTVLFWPWSQRRIFWDVLPIIDPLFTLLLFLGLVFSFRRSSAAPAQAALMAAALFTLAAAYQHHRALELQQHLAANRSHRISHERVMPTVGNILVWRSLYEDSGRIYADALRILPWGKGRFWPGDSKEKFRKADISPMVPPGSQLDRDLDRLQWFADDYLIFLDPVSGVIGDARFSATTMGLQPFWGIRADVTKPEQAVTWLRFSSPFTRPLRDLWKQVRGDYPGFQ
jgi:inner membrane protein